MNLELGYNSSFTRIRVSSEDPILVYNIYNALRTAIGVEPPIELNVTYEALRQYAQERKEQIKQARTRPRR